MRWGRNGEGMGVFIGKSREGWPALNGDGMTRRARLKAATATRRRGGAWLGVAMATARRDDSDDDARGDGNERAARGVIGGNGDATRAVARGSARRDGATRWLGARGSTATGAQ